MPQHQYLASYLYIISVYTSLYYILKHKISNLTTYTCVMANTDFSFLFIRQNFMTINLQPASIPPFKCTSLLRLPQSSPRFQRQHRLSIKSSLNFTAYLKETDPQSNIMWLSGRALDSRPKGRGFEPHRRRCVVSLSKNINPSLVLVQPRKTRPFITERLLMGRKESNQTNKYSWDFKNPFAIYLLKSTLRTIFRTMIRMGGRVNANKPNRISSLE